MRTTKPHNVMQILRIAARLALCILPLVSACDTDSQCPPAMQEGSEDHQLAQLLAGKTFALRSYQRSGAPMNSTPKGHPTIEFRSDGSFVARTGGNTVQNSQGAVDTIAPYYVQDERLKMCGPIGNSHMLVTDPDRKAQEELFIDLLESSPSIQPSKGTLLLVRDGVGALIFNAP